MEGFIAANERAYWLYERGRELMAAGDWSAASEVLRQSIELEPHFKTLEVLGECFLKLGQPRRAVVPLAAATALNDQVRAPSLLAQAFLECGELEKAHRIATLASVRDPTNHVVRRVLDATEHLRADE